MQVKTTAELILFTTVRVEAGTAVGTAFIVSHSWKKPGAADQSSGHFLVTNKHVVGESTTGTITFTVASASSDRSPSPHAFEIPPSLWSLWSHHPDSDIDVCALPLGPIAASFPDDIKLSYRTIPTDMGPNESNINDIGLIEDLLFIGYPSGIFDDEHNLPIARKGITATPPNVDYRGRPVFLIDASVFPGSSGSPVFLYNVGGWRSREGLVAGDRVIFLGVLASVFYREADGSIELREAPTHVEPLVRTREMIDLGIVYKARTVEETIVHLLRQWGELPRLREPRSG